MVARAILIRKFFLTIEAVRIRAPLRIDAGMDFPIVIHLAVDVEEEFFLPPGIFICIAFHGFLSEDAAPFDVVGMLLEIGDADTEVVEFIRELSRQLVDHRFVGSRDVFLRHGLGHHLCHLVARDVLAALERVIAISFNDMILCKLRDRIVCPMVLRDIGERVGGSQAAAGRAEDERRNGSSENVFLLHTVSLQK